MAKGAKVEPFTNFKTEDNYASCSRNGVTSYEDDPNVTEIVASNKGGPKLIHRGYMYTLHKKQPKNIRWRCVGRSMHCRSSLMTTKDCTKPRVRIDHNHKPDYRAVQIARKRYLALGKPYVLTDLFDDDDEIEESTGSDEDTGRLIKEDPIPKMGEQSELKPGGKESFSIFGGNLGLETAESKTTAATAGRLLLVASTDTGNVPTRRPKQGQEQDPKEATEKTKQKTKTVAKENLLESIRLESVAMKQEPEDEEDCYLEETELPSPTASGSSANSPNGRHANTTHRVRSHSRSLRAMANPSAVWAHFDLCANDPLRAQCRICGAVVVRGGANPRQCGTTNLHRHLRVHHGGRLIGRRYHVLPTPGQSNSSGKTIRITAQSLVRPHIRNIAPAPVPQQQKHSQNTQQQGQRQTKTLVLKTIPLKVKQVAPTTIKMPPRQAPTTNSLPQNIVHQQPAEVCLRWNSYHSNMQNSFPSLLDSEQFVDVTLACEGRSLKCHKMILSSCSDYLAELLRENPCQHPIILMKDLKFWEIEALVKFMYRGEVNVAHDKLPQLLNAAEALQVKGLAGPSPSSQSSKPPPLIPQSQTLLPQPVISRVTTETKENKPTSSGSVGSSSPKRGQKRQSSDPSDPKPFAKIRLQRPTTPTSPITAVKMEPLDIPLSPTEIFPDNNEDSSNTPAFEKLITMHEEDDPGGNETNDDTTEMNFCDLPGPPDINDSEDQMEFVPTDFLEQEQDIVEEAEIISNTDIKDEFREYSPFETEASERNSMDKEQTTKDRQSV